MRLVPLASITLACALGTTAARADNVTFTGFAHGSETVAFSLVAPNGPASGTVNAGGFATILNGSPSFVTYCVDLYQHISFGTLYPEYTAPGTTHTFANNRAYSDLGRLYANAGVIDTSVEEAAFQIAVWEIAYETTPGAYALGSGAASFSGGSAAGGALGLAATWLSRLGQRARPQHQRDRKRRSPGRDLCARAGTLDLPADARGTAGHGRGLAAKAQPGLSSLRGRSAGTSPAKSGLATAISGPGAAMPSRTIGADAGQLSSRAGASIPTSLACESARRAAHGRRRAGVRARTPAPESSTRRRRSSAATGAFRQAPPPLGSRCPMTGPCRAPALPAASGITPAFASTRAPAPRTCSRSTSSGRAATSRSISTAP